MHCAAIEFRIETGRRMGEALALKRGDIDAKRYRMLARVTMYTDSAYKWNTRLGIKKAGGECVFANSEGTFLR